MSNFAVVLALSAGAQGVPFLPTRTALGSDVARANPFFAEIQTPVWGRPTRPSEPRDSAAKKPAGDSHPVAPNTGTPGVSPASTRAEKIHAVRALNPDVTVVHVQRADQDGNAHCWGNFGVMLEGVRAARRVIVVAEEIVAPEVIASDPNRTAIPGFLVSAVVECPFGAHPSPVQGYYKRDDAFFRQYHEQSKTPADFERWAARWVYGVEDRAAYINQLGACRVAELGVKQHAYAAATDYGY